MKKLLILTILIALTVTVGFAQTDKKNIVKVFPTSFIFGKGTIGYERVINENGSLTFNLGLPTGIDPVQYATFDESEINLLDGKLDGFVLMPGYRFNLAKKNAPIGFYIEPYLKYESFKLESSAEFIDDENERFMSDLDSKYSGFGAGFQMGFLFLISDVVSVEWSFFGIEAKTANAKILYTDLSGEVDIDDVYDELIDIVPRDTPLIGKKMEYEKGSDYVKVKASNFFLPGLRTAISLGIAF